MNDLFFDELKKNLKENPISAAFLANKVQEAIDVKTFATVNQALKALKQGEFVVGYSYTPIGVEWDNAYRLQGNKFYAYKFTPFIVERPIKMFPSESAMLPACVSGEFLDDFIKDWLDSLHHGFALGDDSLLDLNNIPKFNMDEIADKLS